MDVETLTRFFMWCTIINAGLLILTTVMLVPGANFAYGVHSKFFAMSRETWNALMFGFVGLFKTLWFVFNVVPYVALLIIGG